MKKILSLAILASVIALPAFAQSFDPDLGTGNLVPPVANMGAAGAYAQAPGMYDICSALGDVRFVPKADRAIYFNR